jgi:hypothetical protein
MLGSSRLISQIISDAGRPFSLQRWWRLWGGRARRICASHIACHLFFFSRSIWSIIYKMRAYIWCWWPCSLLSHTTTPQAAAAARSHTQQERRSKSDTQTQDTRHAKDTRQDTGHKLYTRHKQDTRSQATSSSEDTRDRRCKREPGPSPSACWPCLVLLEFYATPRLGVLNGISTATATASCELQAQAVQPSGSPDSAASQSGSREPSPGMAASSDSESGWQSGTWHVARGRGRSARGRTPPPPGEQREAGSEQRRPKGAQQRRRRPKLGRGLTFDRPSSKISELEHGSGSVESTHAASCICAVDKSTLRFFARTSTGIEHVRLS